MARPSLYSVRSFDGGAPLPSAWQCELDTDALTWSPGVFALFGIPADTPIERPDILAMYSEESRALLERVRATAIAECGSFTLDTRIRRLDGEERWIRITADVACRGRRPKFLYGLKQDITDEVVGGDAPFLGPFG